MEPAVETALRPDPENLKPDRAFRHAVTVTSAAFTGAIQTGLKGGSAASHRPYHTIHDDTIKADITQTAVRAAVPACAPCCTKSLLLRTRCAGGNGMVKTRAGRSRKPGADGDRGPGRKRGGSKAARRIPLRRPPSPLAPPPGWYPVFYGTDAHEDDMAEIEPNRSRKSGARVDPGSGRKRGGAAAARLRGAPPVPERPDGRGRGMMAPLTGFAAEPDKSAKAGPHGGAR